MADTYLRGRSNAGAKAPQRRTPQWVMAQQKGVAEQTGARYSSRAIERALDVMESFGFNNGPHTLKEISIRTSQPEQSLCRILGTLQKRGYLLQNPNGSYQLAQKVLDGYTLDMAERLRELARPTIEELGRKFDETVLLSCVFTDHIQVLDTVETFHSVRVTQRTGRIIPPHCSSMGKAILSHLDRKKADRILDTYGLTPRTRHSITDPPRLRRELEESRRRGFAIDREESVLGGTCYGAAIFSSGKLIGALSVSTPIQRLTPDREDAIRVAVMEAARRVSEMAHTNADTFRT
jgi:DNA-binding IclR family transcriptional regulator